MQEIRTFHPRRGRMTPAHFDALNRLLPQWQIPAGTLDVLSLTSGATNAVVVEIGFGVGDATMEMAQRDPQTLIIAIDVHTPGVAQLLLAIERLGLTNIRLVHDDAVVFLRQQVPEAALAEIRVFFPDPWPKARHHKRRLIRPELVTLMAQRLAPDGILHCATDWAPYAEVMLEVLAAEPLLTRATPDMGERRNRPMTKFERTGIHQGREVSDLVFRRLV